jgi:hypothetical protein
VDAITAAGPAPGARPILTVVSDRGRGIGLLLIAAFFGGLAVLRASHGRFAEVFAIGYAVFAAMYVALAVWFFRRHRRRLADATAPAGPTARAEPPT